MGSIGSKGLLKRALPFFAAFAVALFITSFFVDLSRPRFGRSGRWHKGQEMQRLRAENEQLKAEIERMRSEMESRDWMQTHHPGRDQFSDDLNAPPPPPRLLVPVAPRALK